MTTPEVRSMGLATPFRHLPNAISIMRMVLVVPGGVVRTRAEAVLMHSALRDA